MRNDFNRKEHKGHKVGTDFKPAPTFFVFYAFSAVNLTRLDSWGWRFDKEVNYGQMVFDQAVDHF